MTEFHHKIGNIGCSLGYGAMKFAREYEATLQHEQYPQHWIQSSISYRQLKKCIRNIQLELRELGLDSDGIKELLHPNTSGDAADGKYSAFASAAPETGSYPKLTFIVQIDDGELVDATLSPRTKDTLRKFVGRDSTDKEVTALARLQTHDVDGSLGQKLPQMSQETAIPGNPQKPKLIRVEVPLKHNNEFFEKLQYGLSGLNNLYDQEKTALSRDIEDLGHIVSRVAIPSRHVQQSDLYAWRAIFELYLECNIFFSTSEKESFSRSPEEAQKQLQLFSIRLNALQKANKFHKKESYVALQRFLLVNANLLRNLKFQQLNMRAAGKILKSKLDVEVFSPQTMAKYMCAQLSNEVLAIVPQLNDYLCPVCFSISYKPIRLRCRHVFCIRCMVVMQRSKQTHCPLCRGDVVMQADSGNLDPALMNFLKTFFPVEVKQKQKENERSAGVDRYGTEYEKCTLM
ncbi:MAG: hypothetical protein L6R39_005055 [Caloplaca ligustica]|nr:MAG: hypothetical protein L6R39_005055 [Caloplaca ligustica]